MIKNYLRTIWKNKSNSFLNIFGLAIGVACAGLIFLWIENEVNYDHFPKKSRLYKVMTNQHYDGNTRTFGSTPGPLAEAMKAEMPGVANTGRVMERELLFNLGEKSVFEKGMYADAQLAPMLDLKFVQGDGKNIFPQLYSVVISEKIARQFFGASENVIGKTIKIDNSQEYAITGVIADLPANSTLQFDWFAPFEVYAKTRESIKDWGSNSVSTYAELSPGVTSASINKLLYNFLVEKSGNKGVNPFLFQMKDWRLKDNFEDGIQTGGRITYVRMFAIIAWVILIIACINFMNLSTARSEKRAREVGVRKVLGAGKKVLVRQFLGETILLSFLSVLVGALIIMLILPAFNTWVETDLRLRLDQPLHLLFLVGIALVCGVIAGSYPAFYLSSFKPISVLKGFKLKGNGAAIIRKGLVVTQFTVSIVLIIATIIIYQQIQHVKNRDLGYNKDHLIAMRVRGDMVRNFSTIKQELIKTGLFENAALNSFETMSVGNNTSGVNWEGKDESRKTLTSIRFISREFISTAGLQVIAGRDFHADGTADTSNVLITSSLAKLMGKETAVGKVIQYNDEPYQVVGVVKDFVYGDMYGASDPVIFFCSTTDARYLYTRVSRTASSDKALAALEKVMKQNNPAYPFDYKFVDEQFNEKFKSEMLVGRLSRIFAILAIFISCLGLFGLAAYTAERRTREIGIRKVLGASVSGITELLSKDFLQLVFLSAIIAFPLAWWVMNDWLQGYAYRITIHWSVFLIAGLAALVIAMLTVSFQAIRAAMANPVKALRAE
jgi:putative ABC transport system permease protein